MMRTSPQAAFAVVVDIQSCRGELDDAPRRVDGHASAPMRSPGRSRSARRLTDARRSCRSRSARSVEAHASFTHGRGAAHLRVTTPAILVTPPVSTAGCSPICRCGRANHGIAAFRRPQANRRNPSEGVGAVLKPTKISSHHARAAQNSSKKCRDEQRVDLFVLRTRADTCGEWRTVAYRPSSVSRPAVSTLSTAGTTLDGNRTSHRRS